MIAPSKVLVSRCAAYPKQSTTNSCSQVYSNATHPMLHGAQRRVLVSTATDRSRQFDQNHLFLLVCRYFSGALGRTRTCDLLIRSHSPSQTRDAMKRQEDTKPRFYQGLVFLRGQGGTGRDTRLRSDCGQNLKLSSGPYSRKPQKVTKASFRQLGE